MDKQQIIDTVILLTTFAILYVVLFRPTDRKTKKKGKHAK